MRRRRLAWPEVERIAYNGVSRWFFLTGPGAQLACGSRRAWPGFGDFADLALARLRPEVLRGDDSARTTP